MNRSLLGNKLQDDKKKEAEPAAAVAAQANNRPSYNRPVSWAGHQHLDLKPSEVRIDSLLYFS